MREFSGGGPRAQGPAMVWAGRDEGPALVVVDPAGEARHHTLPASWDELARRYRIAWCRVPASARPERDVEDALETLANQQAPVDVVASGTACPAAASVAARFATVVRQVLLVDPPAELTVTEPADVPARVVARSTGGHYDQVEPPLPLGHPEVVEALAAALLAADAEPSRPSTHPAG